MAEDLPQYSFTIGGVLPADDPLAQFVTVVAMISNDWQRLMVEMENIEGLDDRDREGHELLNYRLQAALHYEATLVLREASKIADIVSFVDGLSADAKTDRELVLSGVQDPSGQVHGAWLVNSRNRDFHYSHRGEHRPIAEALEKAAGDAGTVTWGRRFGLRRFGFADNVVLEWFPPQVQYGRMLERMSDAVLALARFSEAAVGEYMVQHGLLDRSQLADIGRQRADVRSQGRKGLHPES